jgi:hypothetical protein
MEPIIEAGFGDLIPKILAVVVAVLATGVIYKTLRRKDSGHSANRPSAKITPRRLP